MKTRRIVALQQGNITSVHFPTTFCTSVSPDFSTMGVKMLQCFPFYRRCKERCKGKDCPPAEVPIEEMKPRLCSSTSCGSDSEGAGNLSRSSQIYFSTKARLSFRHQLDSNINAVDATY